MRVDAIFQDSAAARARADTSTWPDLIERLLAGCHPDELAFVLDPSRYVAEIVGRGGGKTHGMITRFLRRMFSRRGARCFYCALTKDHAREVIWLDLKERLRELGFHEDVDVIYNETKLSATLTRNGASLKLIGADKIHDVEKLRGPTYAEVGIDEMGAQTDKIVRYLIDEIVGPRLVGAVCLGGTAGHQPVGMWYEVTGPGSAIGRLWSDRETEPEALWSVHRWTLESAVAKTAGRPIAALVELLEVQRIEIAKRGWNHDNPKRRREYDADWCVDNTEAIYNYRPVLDDDAPWNRWKPLRTGPLGFAVLPTEFAEWVHIVALDLGSADPTSINVFATALDDRTCTIYHRYGYEQKRLYAKPIAQLLLGEHLDHEHPGGIIGAIGRWPNGMVADASHLGQAILDELGDVYGIAVEPATKGWHYKLGAIEVLKGDFHENRFRVLDGSELEKQLMTLQWALNTRGELVEPRGPRNDAADTAVYGRQLIAEFMTARGEAPDPDEPASTPPAAGTPPARPRQPLPADDDDAYERVAYDDED